MKPALAAAMLLALIAAPAAARVTQEDHVICSLGLLDPDKRIAACTAIIRDGKSHPRYLADAHVNRGNGHEARHHYARAIEDYNQALRRDPVSVEAFVFRSRAHAAVGQFERALRDADEAVRLDPSTVLTVAYRCWARAVAGQLDAALTDCEDAIRDHPNSSLGVGYRALVHLKAGRIDAALADYAVALRKVGLLEMDAFFARGLYGRGVARRIKGDAAGSAADIAAATKHNPGIADEMARYGVK